MRHLRAFSPALAAILMVAILAFSMSTRAVFTPSNERLTSVESSPDEKTPYFVDLRTIVPVVCFTFPKGVDPDNLDKITPAQLEQTAIQFGSGTIIAHDRVLTAQHVVEGATMCTIAGKVPVKVSYINAAIDIAVLDAPLGSSPVTPITCDPYAKDQPYLMFGYAKGTEFALDFGKFSGQYADMKIADPSASGGIRIMNHMALFPGSTTPGMSGGPVIDMSGHVVGINNATGDSFAASRQLADTELCTALKPAPTAR